MSNQLTPKQRFLTNMHAAKHQDWCRSECGKAAIEAALAEMTMMLSDDELVRLAGARTFAKILLNLSEPDEIRKPLESSTLKY